MEKTKETNESWVRNKLTPVLNYMAMIDADKLTRSALKPLIKKERKKAMKNLSIIKKHLEKK